MLTFHIISIFPRIVEEYCNESILKKAKEKNLVDFKFYNLRDFTQDKHGKIDDRPYGGGPGMVMNAEPILACVEHIKILLTSSGKVGNKIVKPKIKIVNFVPTADKWDNVKAKKFTKYTDIIMLCGRYEGIDNRVQKILKSEEVSIGDFVLTGGEVPAMVLIDSISRQVKGILGNFKSLEDDRESGDRASEMFFTRPEILEWKNKKYKVPAEFLSGDPKRIVKWKKENSKTIC